VILYGINFIGRFINKEPSYIQYKMMKKLILFLICLISICSVSHSQNRFNKLYSHYHQLSADRLIEYNNSIYFAGFGLDTLNVFGERNMQMTSLDFQGNLVSGIMYNNEMVDEELSSAKNTDIFIYNDSLLLPYGEISGPDCLLYFDSELTNVYNDQCFDDDDPDPRRGSAVGNVIKFIEDHLTIFMSTIFRQMLLVDIDLKSGREFILHDLSREGYRYGVSGLFVNEEGLLTIVGGYDLLSSNGMRVEDEFGKFIISIDESYNIIEGNYYPDDLASTEAYTHSIMDSEGYIIHSDVRMDRATYDLNGTLILLPVLQKINKSTGEVLWERIFDDAEYEIKPDHITAIVESHNRDGYIVTGWRYINDSRQSYGSTYTKYDLEGNVVWSNVLFDDHENTRLGLRDVIATSDGGYVASGFRDDRDPNDGIDTRVQAWVIKFDENGELDLLSNTKDITDEVSGIQVYPNPIDEFITITKEKPILTKTIIVNSLGQELLRKETIDKEFAINTSSLSSGQYFILIMDENGTLLKKETVIKN
jgi:hypothetical protein